LYYRLNVIRIELPPLRERREDIVPLANALVRELAGGRAPPRIDDALAGRLAQENWPGNVRELRNVVERLLLLCDTQVDRDVVESTLPHLLRPAARVQGTLAERVEAFERETLLAALGSHNFHMTETAKALGLERSHLYKKCQQLGIDLQSVRRGG